MKLSKFIYCILVLSFSMSVSGAPRRSGPSASTTYSPKWGYIDKTGKVVIEPRYDDAGGFRDGLAPVMIGKSDESRWGYIDKSDKMAIQPQFTEAAEFSEGLAAVRIGDRATGKWVFIDKTGAVVLRPDKPFAMSFRDGLALVAEFGFRNGKEWQVSQGCGYIDKNGKQAIEPQYELADSFGEGLAPVRIGIHGTGKYGYINTAGKVEIDPQYHVARPFSEGLACVHRSPNFDDWGYIDKTGEMVIAPQFPGMMQGSFSGGIAQVSLDFFPSPDSRRGPSYIDRTGKFVWRDKNEE